MTFNLYLQRANKWGKDQQEKEETAFREKGNISTCCYKGKDMKKEKKIPPGIISEERETYTRRGHSINQHEKGRGVEVIRKEEPGI